jgi:hypothetical protein
MVLTAAIQMFLTGKDYTPRTAEWYETMLTEFAAWMDREHAVTHAEDVRNPQVLKNVKKPVLESKVKGPLTPAHVAALFRAAKPPMGTDLDATLCCLGQAEGGTAWRRVQV